MADSRAIAARVHPDVHEWAKSEAERQGTTLGSFVEELLRSAYLSEMEAREHPESEDDLAPEPEEIPIQSAEVEDGELVVEAGSRHIAEEVREELSEYLLNSDDKRMTEVRLSPDAKGEIAGL